MPEKLPGSIIDEKGLMYLPDTKIREWIGLNYAETILRHHHIPTDEGTEWKITGRRKYSVEAIRKLGDDHTFDWFSSFGVR